MGMVMSRLYRESPFLCWVNCSLFDYFHILPSLLYTPCHKYFEIYLVMVSVVCWKGMTSWKYWGGHSLPCLPCNALNRECIKGVAYRVEQPAWQVSYLISKWWTLHLLFFVVSTNETAPSGWAMLVISTACNTGYTSASKNRSACKGSVVRFFQWLQCLNPTMKFA